MKIVVFGNGFLGTRIAEYLGAELISARIERPEDIAASLPVAPDVIVNMIGKTGRPNVDWCEDNKEETWFANVEVPKLLAAYAEGEGARLVHFSSGCVYQGDNDGRGFSEDDRPTFEGSYYSHTKAEAERALAAYDNVLVIRPRMPISEVPSKRNLVNKLLGYKKIILIPNSVTVIEDMLPALSGLIRGAHTGVFNMVNPDPVTHRDVLELYEKYAGIDLGKEYIEASALDVKAPRSNTILNTRKLAELDLELPNTKESLDRVIRRYVEKEKGGNS